MLFNILFRTSLKVSCATRLPHNGPPEYAYADTTQARLETNQKHALLPDRSIYIDIDRSVILVSIEIYRSKYTTYQYKSIRYKSMPISVNQSI
jgi:hypothetical protein